MCFDQTIQSVIFVAPDSVPGIPDPNQAAASVIVQISSPAQLVGDGDRAAQHVIDIAYGSLICINDFLHPSADVTLIERLIAAGIDGGNRSPGHGVIGIGRHRPRAVRDPNHPIAGVIFIGRCPAVGIHSGNQPVHGIISIGSDSALCIRLRQLIAIGIVSIGQGVAQRITPLKDPIHLVIGEDAGIAFFIGDSYNSACIVKGIQDSIARPVRLPDQPSLGIVFSPAYRTFGIRDREQAVHGVIGIAP